MLEAASIFSGAFLLFLVEPLIAKTLLPLFGGSASVWTTCLLFFQLGLLAGYLYAHASAARLRQRTQVHLHLLLLGLSLLALPLMLSRWRPPIEDPALRILVVLFFKIGLPYFVLAATSPLLQAWHTNASRSAFPYRLYALSNVGSLLALLGYPVFVEPHLALRLQTSLWAAGYGIFAALCGTLAFGMRGVPDAAASAQVPEGPAPSWPLRLTWLALAACASILLMAVTNHLSQNVAAIPFLWVLPLSLYLLSFILCFSGAAWRWERSFLAFPLLAFAAMTYGFTASLDDVGLKPLIAIFCVGLFICCMVCHGELARLKPAPRFLTSFYLMLALGGALGGLFVGVLAPRLFPDFYELPLGIGACAVIAWWKLYRDETRPWWDPSWLLLGAATLALCAGLFQSARDKNDDDRLTLRNFYGVLHVSRDSGTGEKALRTLTHGTIIHGEQYLSTARRMRPTTYYGSETGIGLTMREAMRRGPLRVGVIGLGTGTMAAYGRRGDVYRFYEINPLTIGIADSEFSFLKGTGATVEIAPGDARLTMESEPSQDFDVLVVDAFSGDSIPVHLLTREALDLYWHNLKPGGVLAVHVSNLYLDLEPVVAAAAAGSDKEARTVETEDDDANDVFGADWVLLTSRRAFFADPLLRNAAIASETRPELRPWTDDYSNLYQLLR